MRTSITAQDMFAELDRGISVPPVSISKLLEMPVNGGDPGYDAIVEAHWGEQRERFLLEIKTSSQPGTTHRAALFAQEMAGATGLEPMIFVPYLSEESLVFLDSANVSGFDLCGNMLIKTPRMNVWRSGGANQFRESASVRNPFVNDQSVFSRAFLLRRKFDSLAQLQQFVVSLSWLGENASPSLGSASKIVNALEEDLIVEKRDGYQLRDPQRLIRRFRESCRKPFEEPIVGSTSLSEAEVWNRLANSTQKIRYVADGTTSAFEYGVLAGERRLALYVDNVPEVLDLLEIQRGRAFANIELTPQQANWTYFDRRRMGEKMLLSPIQTCAELAQGGPREMEAADVIATRILQELRD